MFRVNILNINACSNFACTINEWKPNKFNQLIAA